VSPLVAGPPGFITLSNVIPSSTATAFTVSFQTDQPVICRMDWWSQDDPSVTGVVTIVDAGATTQHTFTTASLGAGHAGKHFNFRLSLDPTDVSGKTLRPYFGTIQLIGARAGTALAVPVRFYTFGGTPPPTPGGGGIGNWSTYTWAQYNPKGSIYPAP
jgi:hypothetical protein